MYFDKARTTAILFLLTLCDAIPADHVVHEARSLSNNKWRKRSRVPPDSSLPFRIGLAQNNLEKGYDYLMDVSDPASSNYGKFWKREEVIAKFAPSEHSVKAVKAWLNSSGISEDRIIHYENKGWLAIDTRAHELENLVYARFHEYEHMETDHTSIGTDQYHLPAHIQPHVDYITPGIKLSPSVKPHHNMRKRHPKQLVKSLKPRTKPPPKITDPDDLTICNELITPACIRALHDIPLPSTCDTPNPNNTLGIFSWGDRYAQEDLDVFFKRYAPWIPKGTHPLVNSIDGGTARGNHTVVGEVLFDIDMAYPIIYPQQITVFANDDRFWNHHPYTPPLAEFNTFLDALDGSYCNWTAYGEHGDAPQDPKYPDPRPGGYKGKRMCGAYKATNVISVSYGAQEYNYEINYQKRQCAEFMKLGLQGTSILWASGDFGAGGPPWNAPNDNGCLGAHGEKFNPPSHSTCYAVTAVGGTEIVKRSTVHDPPRGWFLSGGGFSNLHHRPGYQDKAVNSYLRNHKPPYPSYVHFGFKGLNEKHGRYNRLGRATPDLAASAKQLAASYEGELIVERGTSASAPIVAGIVNRINEERLKKGKGPVGFINPVLYAYPDMLNDITNGTTPACGTEGWRAVKGWDPVTGLGTPNYPKMLKRFMSLP